MNEEEFIKQIGASIARIREKKALSQGDLATMCGITKKEISLIETGKCDAPILTIHHIACELNVSIIDLLN